MKINSIPHNEKISTYQAAGSKGLVNDSIKPQMAADKVELSKEAQKFSELFKIAASDLDARTATEQERVDKVAQQVEKGEYYVSGYDVAGKILGEL